MPSLLPHFNVETYNESESKSEDDEDEDMPSFISRVNTKMEYFSNNENVNFVMDKKKVRSKSTCNTYTILEGEGTSDSENNVVSELISRPGYEPDDDSGGESED